MLSFSPFRLDMAAEQLWKGGQLIAVRRKPFAILRYLVANPKRLVTHEELLKEVWGGIAVSDSAVRTHLHELRQLLGDGFIETVIGRGYRFTAAVAEEAELASPSIAPASRPDRMLVGRNHELEVLRSAVERARTGQRQVCFVTGEPGIGKTSLVDAFIEGLASDVLAVRGHSIEQHSTPEAYLPLIEILGHLRDSTRGEQALLALVRYAPTFLAQVPHLIPQARLEEVAERAARGNETKMVRELIEALESMCMHEPLVIVLEDLQWSDVATIDLLSLIGQRRERAKLLVIATSRRADAQTVAHPLNRVMRTLVARSGAIAVPLDRIDSSELAQLIESRFPGHAIAPGFIAVVDRITAGTPLFIASLLDDLVARGMLAERDGGWTLTVSLDEVAAHRPDNVKQLIDIQLDRLTAQEQRILEAASLVGQTFSTALIASALEIPVEQADEVCDALARRGLFLNHAGVEHWPDGSQQSRYSMLHGLVQEVCSDRSAPARRQRWHRLIAERIEAAYADRAPEVSATLAAHYEQGQSVARAVFFYALAAERMALRFANVDALPFYRRALELLKRTPESAERDAIELRILGGMASTILRNRFQADEAIDEFRRMIALAHKLGDVPRLCAAMVSLSVRYATLARYPQANELNGELAAMLDTLDPVFTASISAGRALPLFWQGKVAATIELLEPLTRPEAITEQNINIGILEPLARKTVLSSYLGASYWLAGSPDRGLREIERARMIARGIGDPYTLGLTTINLARMHWLRRDPVAAVVDTAQAVLADPDAPVWHPYASLLVDCANSVSKPLTRDEVARMLAVFRERITSIPMGQTNAAIPIIVTLRRSDHASEASELVEQMIAFARESGERLFEPELLRLRGELVEAADPSRASACYEEALALATDHGAHSLVLRAAHNLAVLHAKTEQRSSAFANLSAALEKISDGFDVPDVVEAKQLLDR
jgi:DNA-binding winged helix-turn-helix (wHTH) protein/tetratricopeptide (TPR) repeat protein